ncbi:MAG: phosphotransferase [Ignavibacteria bacterium]
MSYKREIILNNFQELFFNKFGTNLDSIIELKADASERKIYRLFTNGNSFIGIYNNNIKENIAFINFTNTFVRLGFNVPIIINISGDNLYYIEDDLGDMTLFKFSAESAKIDLNNYYKKALADLIKFQVNAKEEIDYSYCYQTKAFNPEVLMYDFKKFNEYFNNIFLKNKLDDEVINNTFLDLAAIISKAENHFFLYRDFQPRNIMIKNNELYYIDYQSGRRGPLQYDVASFLYSGSISLIDEERNALIDYYLKEINKIMKCAEDEFRYYFYYFAFARIIQVLGAYGYQYKTRNDNEMIKKIYKAVNNLKSLENKIVDHDINDFIKKIADSFGNESTIS